MESALVIQKGGFPTRQSFFLGVEIGARSKLNGLPGNLFFTRRGKFPRENCKTNITRKGKEQAEQKAKREKRKRKSQPQTANRTNDRNPTGNTARMDMGGQGWVITGTRSD